MADANVKLDLVGWHVAKVGDRWAALEPIRQVVQRTHGQYAPRTALDLGLRMDSGCSTRRTSSWASCAGWGSGRARATWSATGSLERWMRTLNRNVCTCTTSPRSTSPAGDRRVHRAVQTANGCSSGTGPRPRSARASRAGGVIKPPICPGNRDVYTLSFSG